QVTRHIALWPGREFGDRVVPGVVFLLVEGLVVLRRELQVLLALPAPGAEGLRVDFVVRQLLDEGAILRRQRCQELFARLVETRSRGRAIGRLDWHQVAYVPAFGVFFERCRRVVLRRDRVAHTSAAASFAK